LYFDSSVGITTILGVSVGDFVTGVYVPDGSEVSKVENTKIVLSKFTTNSGVQIFKSYYSKKNSISSKIKQYNKNC